MKKAISVIFLIFTGIALCSAQNDSTKVTIPQKQYLTYSRFFAGYSGTFINQGLNDLHGIDFGLLYGINIAGRKLPIYAEIGVAARYGHGKDNVHDLHIDGVRLIIPLNFTYRIEINDKWKVAPYAGFAFNLDCLYQTRGNGTTNDLLKEYDVSRVQGSMQTGLNFMYKKFVFGAEFGVDINTIPIKNGNVHTSHLDINVGYEF